MAPKYAAPLPENIYAVSTAVVGVGVGGSTSMLARVSIVDYRGQVVYDTYVLPTVAVTDYRSAITGIQPADLSPANARPFHEVQAVVADLMRSKVIVGHALWSDLSVLGVPHPAITTRDVALYQPFRNALQATQVVGLQTLMWKLMRRRVQQTHTCPLENARAAMDLYRSHAAEWERSIGDGHWPSHLPPSTFSRCYL